MKKIKSLLLSLLVYPFFSSVTSAAAIVTPLSEEFKDLPSIINWASKYILPFATLALIGIIIYAGFIRLTSAGNPEKEKQSMQTLTSGIVGFALILSASLIIGILGAMFGIRLLNIT